MKLYQPKFNQAEINQLKKMYTGKYESSVYAIFIIFGAFVLYVIKISFDELSIMESLFIVLIVGTFAYMSVKFFIKNLTIMQSISIKLEKAISEVRTCQKK